MEELTSSQEVLAANHLVVEAMDETTAILPEEQFFISKLFEF